MTELPRTSALPRLSMRGRILVVQLVVGAAVAALLVAGLVALRSFERHLALSALAHRQIEAIAGIAADADRFSEAVAALLTTGGGSPQRVAAAYDRIVAGIAALDRATREERALLAATGAADESGPAERARAARLRALFDEMNLRTEALFAMKNAGQGDTALGIFFRDVDDGLESAFEALVARAMEEELAELAAADQAAGRAARRLALAVGGVALAVLAALALAGILLHRSVVGRAERLGRAAAALGAGDLTARAGAMGGDELGRVAAAFDRMAAEIGAQRAALLAAREGLEAEVAARTAELSAANARLAEEDRARLRFLADVSHELRTPLTILRGEAEVTLRGRSLRLAEARASLRRILDQARDMGRLVDDLLALARAEGDGFSFERAEFDLAEVAADALREAALLAAPRGIAFEAELSPALVAADRQRMKQLLLILLDNALKHSEPGACVTLRLAAAGGEAVLEVANPSPGLAADALPALLEPFARGPSSGEGSGLGLAIARRLAERQGGSLSLALEAGRLAATIRMPLAPALLARGAA
ncbi:ATP-binding protein [Faunimonas sp. B44]|uniref:ATP-binding protein n=1 Tax=Faunimonas sp. B44 TaxID=3461493 RepID=UPI004043AAA1